MKCNFFSNKSLCSQLLEELRKTGENDVLEEHEDQDYSWVDGTWVDRVRCLDHCQDQSK